MARARMLATNASIDPDLHKLSLESMSLYLLSIPHLDRDGLITGEPILLWAKAAPRRFELMDKAGQYIEEWVTHRLVIRYRGPDGPILFFKGFRKHNANMPYGSEEASAFPPPPGWTRTRQGLVPDDEESCFRLLTAFNPRSYYRKELESRVSRDLLATMSQSGRHEDQDQAEDQVQVQDQVQDQLDVAVVSYVPALLELLSKKVNTHDQRVLTQAMRTNANKWMQAANWQNRSRYLDERTDTEIALLAGWLWLYKQRHNREYMKQNGIFIDTTDRPDPFATIEKPVAFIRWNIAEGNEPELWEEEIESLAEQLLPEPMEEP